MNVDVLTTSDAAGDASFLFLLSDDDGNTVASLYRDEIDALALAVCRHDAETAAALLPQVTP